MNVHVPVRVCGNVMKKREKEQKVTAELDDMKDSKRKSVNAFHLFFVCPKTLNALVRSVSVCNSTSPKLEAKSQMKPYKNGPHGFPKYIVYQFQ